MTWAAIISATLVAACGGGGGDSSTTGGSSTGTPPPNPTAPSNLTINGTAATGAAIANTLIQVECSNGATSSTTSAASGDFTLVVPNGVAPCLLGLEVPNGELLSVFAGQERANITPLTQLLVSYFAGLAGLPVNFTADQLLAQDNIESLVTPANLEAALASVRSRILNAYSIDVGVNFLNERIITPDANGQGANEADGRLEALQMAGGVNANGTPSSNDVGVVYTEGNERMNSGMPNPGDPNTNPGNGGSGVGTASQCYNPTLDMVGTTSTFTYQSRASDVVTNSTTTSTIFGPTNFRGTTVLEQRTDFGDGSNSVFFQTDGPVSTVFGSRNSLETVGFSNESETVFNPPTVDRSFTLQPGQVDSVTENSTTTSVSTFGGVAQAPQTTTSNTTTVTTFLGIETVTVPAGTFQACRFREDFSSQGGSSSGDSWVAVGSGVFLRFLDSANNAETVLTEGTINGMAVRP